MTGPAVDPRAIAEDLARNYCGRPGLVAITSLPARRTRWYPTDQLDQAGRYVAAEAHTQNVYACVSTQARRPQRGRGGAADAVALGSVVLDLDVAGPGHADIAGRLPLPNDREALALLARLPVVPSVIVHTGHGYLARWLLDPPVDIANEQDRHRAADLLAGWNRMFVDLAASWDRHADNVGDLARLTRIGGTVNRKSEPVAVVVVEAHPERRYTPEELARYCAPVPAPSSPPPSQIRPAMAGRESPADAFDRCVDWPAILEPVGFTEMAHRGEATWWRHDAATSPAGTPSATTGTYGVGVLVMFSASASAATGLPCGPGHRLTKFRVWSILRYQGDEAAAARELRLLAQGVT